MSDTGTVGKYTLRRVLGKGAMGVVYEAFDPMIERTVALKTIRKDLWEAEEGSELRERFLREARAAGRLLHPNIVTVYEFGESDGGAYIVMEHVSGRTLKELIDAGKRFSLDEAVQLMVPVLAALGYSHRSGVVHRDIKPANIMVTDDGMVKILDFGVARLASASITQVGTILGTPAYMAPEQLLGQTVDSRADLYSAGVILRELLTGQKTFTGDYGQVLHQVLHGELAKPSAINPAVPAAFDAIVARATARHADERFATAEEFTEALQRRSAPPKPAPQPQAGRSAAVPIAAGLALLLAAGGGAAYHFGLFASSPPQQLAVAEPPAVRKVEPLPEPAPPKVEPTPVKVEPPKPEPAPVKAEPPKPEPAPVKAEPPPEPVPVKAEPVPEPPKPEPAPAKAEPVPEPAKPEPAPVKAEPAPEPEPVKQAEPEPALTADQVVALLAKPSKEPPPAVKAKPVLRVVTDRGAAPRYKMGETMQVTVSTDAQAEIFCFYQSAAGDIVRVFPTRFAPDATVKARQSLRLPGSQPFSFQFDRKNAREEIRCLGVEEGVAAKLPKFLGGGGFEPLPVTSMNALVDTIRKTAGDDVAVAGVVVTVE